MGLDFLGIGAQKSGTTWLYENLRRHLLICFPRRKELHFWDRYDPDKLEKYRAIFAAKPKGTKAGEITPAYAILPVEIIAKVQQEFPELRLIYVMRNPIERAWSAALMVLRRANMTIDDVSDKWFLDYFSSAAPAQKGDYETCLRNWRSFYPSERILVVLFDEIKHDPLSVLCRVADHIGVEPEIFRTMPRFLFRRKVFAGPPVAIRPSLAAVLADLYFPRVERLELYLGCDLSHWRQPHETEREPTNGIASKVRRSCSFFP